MNIDRQLATVRVISKLLPIEGADKIELAIVDGWQVVTQKGNFVEGDKALYFEIDSWIPASIAPFLSKGKEPRVFNGIPGERLKTIKLKGQLSQGLLLPLKEIAGVVPEPEAGFTDGYDLTETLGVQKWEPPVSNDGSQGERKGNFPEFIPKTDQHRIQNVFRSFEGSPDVFEVTEKLDGSSMTVYIKDNVFGVCSRNVDLVEDDTNHFWQAAKFYELDKSLRLLNSELAIQGELIGPGIQGNPYKLTERMFFVFDIWDISNQKYLSRDDRLFLTRHLQLNHVPNRGTVTLAEATLDFLLDFADRRSLLADVDQEGHVYKSLDNPSRSFKVISNKWLLKAE